MYKDEDVRKMTIALVTLISIVLLVGAFIAGQLVLASHSDRVETVQVIDDVDAKMPDVGESFDLDNVNYEK